MSDPPPESAKPAPDEPWRYGCPDCGSVNVEHVPTVSTDERRFRCGRCDWYGAEPALVDRKADTTRTGPDVPPE